MQVINLVYKVLRDFPECVQSIWETYRVRHQGAVQVCTAGTQNSIDGIMFNDEW